MHPGEHTLKAARSALIWLVVLAGAVVVLLPSSPAWMRVPHRDSGVFLYSGARILAGDLPYRDVWDHKPPLIYYLDAAGLALAGGSRWGVWVVEALLLALAARVCFDVLRAAFGSLPAAAATYLFLFSVFFPLQGGNTTSQFVLPAQFACLGLASVGIRGGGLRRWARRRRWRRR